MQHYVEWPTLFINDCVIYKSGLLFNAACLVARSISTYPSVAPLWFICGSILSLRTPKTNEHAEFGEITSLFSTAFDPPNNGCARVAELSKLLSIRYVTKKHINQCWEMPFYNLSLSVNLSLKLTVAC